MKLNKKVISILISLLLILSMVACSDNAENNVSMEAVNEEVTNEVENTTEEAEVVEEEEVNILETTVVGYFENMPDHIYKISQKDFVQMVKDGEDMFIVDIRSAEDYAKGHITGAVNAPWGGSAIADSLVNIPMDKPVFIYCYSGQTAGQAVHTLNVAGINARSVNLGWNFGISKVEGVADVTTTEATEFVALGNDIDPEIQAAIDAYYAGLADVKESNYKNYIVSEANLKQMIDEGDDSIYLLSARKEADFEKGHIAGANLLPFGKDMASGFDSLPMDKTIVVYCYSGQTAGQTVAGLRLLGYDAVSLKGGMGVAPNAPLGWSNKGYMVESPLTIEVMKYFAEKPDHSYKIGQVDFVEMVKNGEEMFILDIRSADDYAKGHIEGAVNAPWGGSAIADNLLNMPTDVPVFIYCYSGQTAGQAVHTLNVAGINARSVNLGWNFGISKVDGVADITTTEAAEFVALGNDIEPSIQEALDAYYAGLADVKGTLYGNYMISEENLKKLIEEKDESIYIVSSRQESVYNEGHIEGAVLLPYGKGMQEEFSSLPTDKTIVVYCYSGQTAGQAVAGLRLLGYDAVSLKGGMGVAPNAPLGWANKGYPVTN